MSTEDSPFELPGKIEKYLAVLSKMYARDGLRKLQILLVNSQIRISDGWSHDNWDGGIDGHAVYLTVPEPLFSELLDKKETFQNKIRDDLNKVKSEQSEFIQVVFIELEIGPDSDWRKESGLLVGGAKTVPPDAAAKIWGRTESFRLFLRRCLDGSGNLKEGMAVRLARFS